MQIDAYFAEAMMSAMCVSDDIFYDCLIHAFDRCIYYSILKKNRAIGIKVFLKTVILIWLN